MDSNLKMRKKPSQIRKINALEKSKSPRVTNELLLDECYQEYIFKMDN
jgi:hypothetical protein